MGNVRFDNIGKFYSGTSILNGVSLEIEEGEFLTLLGPSGCGKSTLLRILAGLENQDDGHVYLAGNIVDGMRPKQRDIAMVFQSYALYPHMTVAANMALPLRMRRLNIWQRLPVIGKLLPGTAGITAGIEMEVTRTANALGIDHLLYRKPGQLSGGQRQRVAVGRAMVRHPAVFLMDEPLSNLDAKLRVQMRTEIKDLHQRLGVTFVYVTHDQAEAMTLSDRVAVMLDGELLQVAPPQDIYADPDDRRVAEFIGSPKINMLDGAVCEPGKVAVANIVVPIAREFQVGTPVTMGIRPEAFELASPKAAFSLSGTVRLVEHMGSDLFVHLDVSGQSTPLIARISAQQAPDITGSQILSVSFDPKHVLFFSMDGKRLREHANDSVEPGLVQGGVS